MRWTTNTTTRANALRSQPTASCRSTRARTSRPRRAAHPARVFRGYASCESAHIAEAAPVLGSGALLYKKYHVKRVRTSLYGLKGTLPHIGADACERSTAQRHIKFPGQNEGAQELRRGTVGWVARCLERGVRRMLPALARW